MYLILNRLHRVSPNLLVGARIRLRHHFLPKYVAFVHQIDVLEAFSLQNNNKNQRKIRMMFTNEKIRFSGKTDIYDI